MSTANLTISQANERVSFTLCFLLIFSLFTSTLNMTLGSLKHVVAAFAGDFLSARTWEGCIISFSLFFGLILKPQNLAQRFVFV